MIYITGDTHGNFYNIENFCKRNKTTRDDVIIILGDVGLNYYGDKKDRIAKQFCQELPITLFCIHGNHEQRASNIDSYKEKIFFSNLVYFEENYPNILFAEDGLFYTIDNKRCLVVGGAYSVDKYYRLSRGWNWWSDEQIGDEVKSLIEFCLEKESPEVLLTHTCPYKYVPRETFLPQIDQSTVDNSMEQWFDKIEEQIEYKKWYCGHYHIQKSIDKIRFLFDNIEEFRI